MQKTYHIPKYVTKFKCASCGECCKNKWRIDIDSKSYNKLVSKIGDKIENYITEVDKEYECKFQKGYCSFITEDKQCQIHGKLGWEYLSDTCKIYPRKVNITKRGVEMALTFSCKSAAKLLLEDDFFEIKNYNENEFFLMSPNRMNYLYPDNSFSTEMKKYYFILEKMMLETLEGSEKEIKNKRKAIFSLIIKAKELQANKKLLKDENEWRSLFENIKKDLDSEEIKNNLFQKILSENKRLESSPLKTLIEFYLKDIFITLLGNEDVLDKKLDTFEEIEKIVEENGKKFLTNRHQEILNKYVYNLIFSKIMYNNPIYGFFQIMFYEYTLRFLILVKSVYLNRTLIDDEIIDLVVKSENYIGHSLDLLSSIWKEHIVDEDYDKILLKIKEFIRD